MAGHDADAVRQLLVVLVQFFRNAFVHDVHIDAVLEVGDHLLGGTLRGVVVRLVRVRAKMRQHDVGDVFHGFFAGSVFWIHVRAELELLHGLQRAEIVFVDNARTCAVDDQRIRLHKIQQAGVDKAARRVVFRNMQRDDVGFFEDILQRAHRGADGFRAFGGNQRVIGENLHIESAGTLRDQLADVTKADDTDRLARQLAAHKLLLLPTACAGRDVALNHMTIDRQCQRDHFLCDCVRIRTRRVHDIDVLLAGILNINGIETCSRADDRLQFR